MNPAGVISGQNTFAGFVTLVVCRRNHFYHLLKKSIMLRTMSHRVKDEIRPFPMPVLQGLVQWLSDDLLQSL